jgi:hypothetical protein
VMVASVERAICDRLYLSPGYVFDNLWWINAEKLLTIASIYNTRVQQDVVQLIKHISFY